jgi:hypothetical protein
MAIVKGAINPAPSGTTTFPESKTIQVTAPNRHSVRPSLVLDFANSKTLDPRITFTRGSNATYYDGTTALAEQNVVKYSQDFSNALWAISDQYSVLTANSTTAPDGTATASTISTTSSGTTYHRFYQSIPSFTQQTQYSFSVYLKYKDHQYVSVGLTDNSYYRCQIMVNLVAGTIVQNYIDAYSSGDTLTSTITSVGNSWYRVTGVYTPATAIVGNLYFLGLLQQNSTFANTGWLASGTGFYMWGAQAEQRNATTAYTPTTSSTISNYVPVLKTAGTNQPRFDVDPLTLESKGLLIEEQRTNLVTDSTTFGSQTVTNCTVYSNAIVAPDGTITGAMIQDNSTNGQHGVLRTYSVTNTVIYTSTVYLKMGTQRYVSLVYPTATSTRLWATFDLLNGTITGSWSNAATITAVGNGWYRVSGVTNAGTTGSAYLELQFNSTGTNPSWPTTTQPAAYAGTGSYFYAWGMQGEAGTFPTSYISTAGATATRAFDYPVISGSNFSSWFNNTAGTVYVEAMAGLNTATGGNAFMYLTDGLSPQNDIYMDIDTGNARFYSFDRGSLVTNINLSTVTAGTSYKIAGAYQLNNFAASKNGNTVVTDTVATVPAGLNQMIIGRDIYNGLSLNSTIKKIAYYPIRLTNAELVSMTTA